MADPPADQNLRRRSVSQQLEGVERVSPEPLPPVELEQAEHNPRQRAERHPGRHEDDGHEVLVRQAGRGPRRHAGQAAAEDERAADGRLGQEADHDRPADPRPPGGGAEELPVDADLEGRPPEGAEQHEQHRADGRSGLNQQLQAISGGDPDKEVEGDRPGDAERGQLAPAAPAGLEDPPAFRVGHKNGLYCFSRPIVEAGPWPASTTDSSGWVSSFDRMPSSSAAPSLLGKSERPIEPAKRASPVKSRSPILSVTPPGEWPGVWRTSNSSVPAR